jgi:hypothetical protein
VKATGVVAAGLVGTAIVAGIWWLASGEANARAAVVAGLLATGAQTLAHVWMAGVAPNAPASAMWRRHLHGTALRVGAAGMVIALTVKDRVLFPPLAIVTSFAALVLLLMSLEIRNRT